jgi:hypothetical protein
MKASQNNGMRLFATTYCVISLLISLVGSPFVHFHDANDDSHGESYSAQLHSHLFQESAHRTESETETGLEEPHRTHQGNSLSLFVGQVPSAFVIFAEVEDAPTFVTPIHLRGFVLEQPVRVHDPPGRRNSNPRSPPAEGFSL